MAKQAFRIVPAFQIVAAGPSGDVLHEECDPTLRRDLVQMVARDVRREGRWREELPNGAFACGVRRGGHAVVVVAASVADAEDAYAAGESMLDTLDRRHRTHLDLPAPVPARGSSGGASGAPAQIAAHTPPRRAS